MKKLNHAFVPCFLFFILFFVLSFFNRFSHDDLSYLKSVQHNGILKSTFLNYESWNTRWAAIFLANCFFYFIDDGKWVWIFHVITLIVLLVSVHKLLGAIKNKLDFDFDFKKQLTYSLLFVLLLFFNTFSIGDVWFWLNASCMYLWNVSAAFFAFAFILDERIKIARTLFIALAGIYIGGSSEPFVLFIVAICFLMFLRFRKNEIKFSKNKLMLFVFFVVAAFTVSYFGKGNSIRSEALPHVSFAAKNLIFLKAFIKLWIFYMPQKFVGSILICFPFAWLGSMFPNKKGIAETKTVFKKFFLSLIFFSALLLYVIVMLMAEAGPERAWTSFSVLISISFAFLFFELGQRNFFAENTLRKFNSLSIILISSLLILTLLNQFTVLKKYSQAYDMRLLVIEKLKNKNITGTVYLPKLPPSGMLRTAEINSQPDYFTNQQLKNYFDLPFDISVKN